MRHAIPLLAALSLAFAPVPPPRPPRAEGPAAASPDRAEGDPKERLASLSTAELAARISGRIEACRAADKAGDKAALLARRAELATLQREYMNRLARERRRPARVTIN
jgi:hypothetical protein